MGYVRFYPFQPALMYPPREVATTNEGYYEIVLPFAMPITAESPGHFPQTRPAVLPDRLYDVARTRLDFLMHSSAEVFEPTSPTCLVSGDVRNEVAGEPIASAQIFYRLLADTLQVFGVLTEVDGSFALPDVPAGVHTFQIRRIGFEDEQRELLVRCTDSSSSVQLPVLLRERPLILQEVVPN